MPTSDIAANLFLLNSTQIVDDNLYRFRAKAAEAALVGRQVNGETARVAGHAALAGAVPLTRNTYKLPVFEVLVCRAVLAAAGGA